MKIINEKEFEQLMSKENVLVDFFADWCGPCKSLAPILEEVSSLYPNVEIVKVNVDNSLELATKFSIMSIPAVIFFKNGKLQDQFVGLRSKEDVCKFLDQNI